MGFGCVFPNANDEEDEGVLELGEPEALVAAPKAPPPPPPKGDAALCDVKLLAEELAMPVAIASDPASACNFARNGCACMLIAYFFRN